MNQSVASSASFETVIKERRSANNFDETIKITRAELEEIFTLTKLAPSASNLQHAHYVVVDELPLKEELKAAAYNQHKVGTSAAAIVVFGDKFAYKNAPQIYEGLRDLGVLSKQEFDQTIASINSGYENQDAFQRDEAIRNASLSAMLFMLVAKDKGWDTCPMIGFDPAAVSKLLNAPDHLVPVMIITIGVEKTSHKRPRGYRKPLGEFVSYGSFQA
ncbi:nitroreductase family protein [Paenibacillus psychroresistens]|uniref:Nitroreductase family protein n=1 Tax=Paenibacillus psychroresistens TaxID=1778678 RepID=A0A6B8REW2_9BACL|nr:nitroreductase family protein [Paenibacillus psychroresistens]QGQ94053.1 nitroreductase family protein [Paenibacillus psychroresistens]